MITMATIARIMAYSTSPCPRSRHRLQLTLRGLVALTLLPPFQAFGLIRFYSSRHHALLSIPALNTLYLHTRREFNSHLYYIARVHKYYDYRRGRKHPSDERIQPRCRRAG